MTKEFIKLERMLLTSKYTQVMVEKDFTFNAPHSFKVLNSETGENIQDIHFQEGPILEAGINGVNNEDLIAMVITRLEAFQDSEFICRENAEAIKKFEEGLEWLRARTEKRSIRGVEGTHTV